jgi:hypothetical protein
LRRRERKNPWYKPISTRIKPPKGQCIHRVGLIDFYPAMNWVFFRHNKIQSFLYLVCQSMLIPFFCVQHSVSQAQGNIIPRALFAFKVSMIHIVLQFTQVIVVCYVRHRVKGPEASIVKSCKMFSFLNQRIGSMFPFFTNKIKRIFCT